MWTEEFQPRPAFSEPSARLLLFPAPHPAGKSGGTSRNIPKIPTIPPRRKCKFPTPAEFGLVGCCCFVFWFFFFFKDRLPPKTWLGRGNCCGTIPTFFPWILLGIDFGTVGSSQTLRDTKKQTKNPPLVLSHPANFGPS